MRRPTHSEGWLAAGVLAVLAAGLFVLGLVAGSNAALIAAALLGGTVVCSAGGYLAVADRGEFQPPADTDVRFAGPLVGCFLVALVATAGNVIGVDTVAGVATLAIAGVGFAGAFVAMACSSWIVEDQPRVALGEAFAAVGWLLLMVPLEIPGLREGTDAGAVLLVTGGALVLLFGPIGAAVVRRLEGAGTDRR